MPPTKPHLIGSNSTLEKLVSFVSRITKAIGIHNTARARRLVGGVVNVFLAVVLGTLLFRNRQILPLVAQAVTPLNVGAYLFLYLVSLLVQFGIWSNLMGYRLSEQAQALDDYIRTILMGKLPGGLWKLFGRMTLYRPSRLSPRFVLALNFIELLVALLANGLLVLLVSPLAWQIRIGLLASIVVALIVIPTRLPQSLVHLRNPLQWVGWVTGYVMAWMCGALIAHFVISSFNGAVTLSDAIRYWCSAGAIGLVLQVLPLSMLVRDVTLVAFLQPSMPLATAIIAAFTLRLILMICELVNGWLLLGVAWVTRRSSYNTSI